MKNTDDILYTDYAYHDNCNHCGYGYGHCNCDDSYPQDPHSSEANLFWSQNNEILRQIGNK